MKPTNNSNSEIHGPWDEARPRLQRTNRRNVYRKRTSN